MFFYILKRILATIPVMVIVAIFVFLLLRLTPGDPAAILAVALHEIQTLSSHVIVRRDSRRVFAVCALIT